jgi:hypothetical protein
MSVFIWQSSKKKTETHVKMASPAKAINLISWQINNNI